jgi:hypothetical protein
MDGEATPGTATMEVAVYWAQVYSEILAMEEKVLQRIRHLMAQESDEVRREVELTNVPVVVAQAERFRQRLGYWTSRVDELTEGKAAGDSKGPIDGHLDGHSDGRLDGHSDGRLDGHSDGHLDGHQKPIGG